MTPRRTFLTGTLSLGALACAPRGATSSAPSDEARPTARDLLILGGTGFIGPHLVRRALARGHRVTIFTRGRRHADLPAEVKHRIGDRDGSLESLVGGRWDAVIDNSATKPERVRRSAELLKDAAGRYLFTSSTGVYYPYLRPGADEDTPVDLELKDPEDGSAAYGVAITRATYLQAYRYVTVEATSSNGSAIWWTSERPRPVPSYWRDRLLSSWTKGWKRYWISSGGMPMPVSQTEKWRMRLEASPRT